VTEANHTSEDLIGAVIIGRNEGERLRRCIESVCAQVKHVVYVDSGSTDGSVELAEEAGVYTVALTQGPFTAASGRQVGLDYLLARLPDLQYVQFVDGDCIVDLTWLDKALSRVEGESRIGAVCGRRHEERCDQSLYSRLTDADWQMPAGEVDAIGGGDALIAVRAVQDIGGWPVDMIAGEDLVLSFRLIDSGWKIIRLPDDMVWHDVAISRFSQYWQRAVRTGHAYVESALLCRGGPNCRWARRTVGIIVYGTVLPLLGATAIVVYWPVAAVVALIYAQLLGRLAIARVRAGDPVSASLAYACVQIVCKVGAAIGVLKFLVARTVGRRNKLIEYKSSPDTPPRHVPESDT